MAGDRVLVTGASKGIGRAIASALAGKGHEVVGTARKPGASADLPPGVRFISLDLLDEASIDACLTEAGPIEVLVNNAGGSSVWAAAEAPPEKLRDVFQLDFFGPVRLIQGVLPGMIARKSGTILNIGSLVWRFGLPYQSAYAAAKAALAAYSSSLRKEVAGRGIRVVILDPGDIRTTIEPAECPAVDPEFGAGCEAFFRVRNAAMAKASPPEVVADKVLEILAKKNPAPYYVAGKGAGTQAFLKRILPDAFLDEQVRKRYGRTAGR